VSLNKDLHPDHQSECKLPGQVVLVFQGGGALGSYQAGVYQALHEADIEPDWIIGTSIGAINASLIAGNRRDDRIPKLREFWKRVESHPRCDFSGLSTGVSDALSNWSTLVGGIPAFFKPNYLVKCPYACRNACVHAHRWRRRSKRRAYDETELLDNVILRAL
jgi:predicted acylesterase/phospholipase RssA